MNDYNYIDMVRLCNKTAWEIADRREKKMNDLISRQAAIKAFKDLPDCPNGYSDTYDKACIIGVLEELPSAQPKIIRCKECKWWVERHPRLGVPWCRQMHIDRDADGYCEIAERSEE